MAAALRVRHGLSQAILRGLALARARMLRTLHSQIEAYRTEIEKLFSKHPDSNLFGSLPGVGEKLGPQLLGESALIALFTATPKAFNA
jgi:transposase